MHLIYYMATSSRLDALYDSNVPSVRSTNEFCESYKEWYNKLIANITITNEALITWYNTWLATYNPSVTDVSLSTIYSSDKTLFTELQTILTDQKNFYDSIKSSKLANADSISFVYGTSVNQSKTLKGKYSYGTVANLSSDISNTLILDTVNDIALTTNRYLTKHYYQVGSFNEESIEIDLWFDGIISANVSDLYDRVINATDGSTVIAQNKRLIDALTFNINRCNSIQTLLTYVKK